MRQNANPDLIEVIKKTLAYNEMERWSVEDVIECKFMQASVDLEAVKQELSFILNQSAENIVIQNVNKTSSNENDLYRNDSSASILEINSDFLDVKIEKLGQLRNAIVFADSKNGKEVI